MPSRLMIGSDPEFAVKRRGSRRVEYAARVISGGTSSSARIGVDGAQDVGELRPPPSYSPEQHIQEIEDLVAELVATYPDMNFYGGGSHGSSPVGGHIHFSGAGIIGSNIRRSSHVIRCLDAFLALPVMMIEGKKASRGRRRSYGTLGDVRRQPHGGFEYRTLPSWLVSKEAATAVLQIAWMIVKCQDEISPEDVDRVGVHSHTRRFYNCDKDFFEPRMEIVYQVLQSLSLASQYETAIDFFKKVRAKKKPRWRQGKPFNRRWGLHKRPDRRRTSAGRQKRRRSRRFQVVGTPTDYRTEYIAEQILRQNIESNTRTTYQLYGLADYRDIDIAISSTGRRTITSHLVSSAMGMGFRIQLNTNFGRDPSPGVVRIGLSLRARENQPSSLVVLLRHIITHLEAEN